MSLHPKETLQYLEGKRIFLWTGYSEELNESVGLVKVSRRVERRWKGLFAKGRSDERRMPGFNGQNR